MTHVLFYYLHQEAHTSALIIFKTDLNFVNVNNAGVVKTKGF